MRPHLPPEPAHDRRARSRRAIALAGAMAITLGGLAVGTVAGAEPQRDGTDLAPHPNDRVEAIELECAAVVRDVASIGCRWSVPTHPRAAAVRLVRVVVGSDLAREVVFRTDDLAQNSFVDSPVRRGVRYAYAIRVVDERGHIVGASRSSIAGVPADRPPTDVEVLRLDCAAQSAVRVTCEWSLPEARARVLTLWRSVDGGARERVASFEQPFQTAYRDSVPEGSSRAVYAVIATDGADIVVARSRAEGVRLPVDEPPVDTRPVDTRPVDTRPVDTRPVDTRPVDTRPVDTRPVDSRPVDSRPVDSRPVDTRPVDTRPVDTRPVDSRPVDTRPVETRPVDSRPVDTGPVDTRPVDTRPVDSRPVDTRPVDTRPVDTRPVDTRPTDARPRPVDGDPTTDERPVRAPDSREARG